MIEISIPNGIEMSTRDRKEGRIKKLEEKKEKAYNEYKEMWEKLEGFNSSVCNKMISGKDDERRELQKNGSIATLFMQRQVLSSMYNKVMDIDRQIEELKRQ